MQNLAASIELALEQLEKWHEEELETRSLQDDREIRMQLLRRCRWRERKGVGSCTYDGGGGGGGRMEMHMQSGARSSFRGIWTRAEFERLLLSLAFTNDKASHPQENKKDGNEIKQQFHLQTLGRGEVNYQSAWPPGHFGLPFPTSPHIMNHHKCGPPDLET
ncbi:hypothetical protein KC320_g90 [Hortaea werneckii]|nr:hypothetical protein KC320_g90 [Hortaea werneckii]